MKKNVFVLIVFLMAVSCKNKSSFTIHGRLVNGDGNKVVLKEMTGTGLSTIDSAFLRQDGKFKLQGAMKVPGFYGLFLSQQDFIMLVVYPGDDITVAGDANDLLGSYSVDGSDESVIVRDAVKFLNKAKIKIDSLSRIYNENRNNPQLDQIKAELDSTFYSITGDAKNYFKRIIETNSNRLISLWALYQQIVPNQGVFDWKKDFSLFEHIDTTLSRLYPSAVSVQTLHNQVQEVRIYMEQFNASERSLSIGKEAPEIALPSPDGKTIALSSTRGKIVLLDFWASWCAPCRSENPHLVDVYNKYRSKGFDIFQVSLDRSKQAWIKAIADDKLTWTQVSDLKFWNSAVVPVYQLNSIPASFLLDQKGVIIAKNLRGKELEQKLSEIFK